MFYPSYNVYPSPARHTHPSGLDVDKAILSVNLLHAGQLDLVPGLAVDRHRLGLEAADGDGVDGADAGTLDELDGHGLGGAEVDPGRRGGHRGQEGEQRQGADGGEEAVTKTHRRPPSRPDGRVGKRLRFSSCEGQ